MRAIKCELCGSTNIIKQEGIYVCQQCGAKYTPAEALKLMSDDANTEQSAPVQNKAKLDELYSLARQARESNDWAAAETYYEALAEKDPNSWEAPFYLAYRKVDNTSINACEENCQNYSINLGHFLEKAQNASEDKEEFIQIAREMQDRTEYLAKTIIERAYEEYPLLLTQDEFIKQVFCGIVMLQCLASGFDSYFKDGEMAAEATDLRKQSVQHYADLAIKLNVGARVLASGVFERVFGEVIAKIKDYDSSYVCPSLVENPSSKSTSSIKDYDSSYVSPSHVENSSSKSSSSGCYVATAVYGSYDCPQVWTLRRYRDYTLAETWYGRLFIRAYYAISPTLVKLFGTRTWFKHLCRYPLDKFVQRLHNRGVKDTPYSDKTIW